MIIFLGIAGSGKGTQASLLASQLDCPTVSIGDLLRANSENPRIKPSLEKGMLVSDEVLLPLLDVELKTVKSSNHFILDGFPRSLDQAKWLVTKIKSGEIKLSGVIIIDLPKEVAMERLLNRGRHDDNKGAIEKRFKEQYDKVITPITDYFTQAGIKVHKINGDQPPEAVSSDIREALAL